VRFAVTAVTGRPERRGADVEIWRAAMVRFGTWCLRDAAVGKRRMRSPGGWECARSQCKKAYTRSNWSASAGFEGEVGLVAAFVLGADAARPAGEVLGELGLRERVGDLPTPSPGLALEEGVSGPGRARARPEIDEELGELGRT